jgi:hypothetical protein
MCINFIIHTHSAGVKRQKVFLLLIFHIDVQQTAAQGSLASSRPVSLNVIKNQECILSTTIKWKKRKSDFIRKSIGFTT